MPYSIKVKYKKAEAPVLNLSFSADGSFHLTDLISQDVKSPKFGVITANYPQKVARQKNVKYEQTYYANSRLKFSHHPSGFFQVSGLDSSKIKSGINSKTGLPKGVGIEAFKQKANTNDGGPIMTVHLWGVNNLRNKNSKQSEEIIFSEKEIDYQSMNVVGTKPSFAFLFFHFLLSKLENEGCKKEWCYYNYSNFKKPLLIRLFKESEQHGYVLGVSCLKSRINSEEETGFYIMGGAGPVDIKTNTCKSIMIIFPASENFTNKENCLSLNY